MKLEQKGFIFSDLYTVLFATPGLVRAFSFKIPPPGGISYKVKNRLSALPSLVGMRLKAGYGVSR
ncbi:MAG: hypothetical protein IKM88_12790, partial [Lachnospiraceae bacterium]|nr:hypothetical protein [Lachnospiraceae bacterium]